MKRLALICLLSTAAYAHTSTPPPAPKPMTTTSQAAASAKAVAGAQAAAKIGDITNASTSTATSGDSQATGGSITSIYPRQLPAIIAPPAFPAIGCGRGVSISGDTLHAGGIVSFNWPNKDCDDFARHVSLAQSLSAVGHPELACAVLLHLPLAAEVWPVLPSCDPQKLPETAPSPPAAPVACVPPETVDKAVRACVGK